MLVLVLVLLSDANWLRMVFGLSMKLSELLASLRNSSLLRGIHSLPLRCQLNPRALLEHDNGRSRNVLAVAADFSFRLSPEVIGPAQVMAIEHDLKIIFIFIMAWP